MELLGAAYHDDRNAVSFPTTHPQNGTGDADWLAEADVVLAIGVPDVPGLLRRRGRSRSGGRRQRSRRSSTSPPATSGSSRGATPSRRPAAPRRPAARRPAHRRPAAAGRAARPRSRRRAARPRPRSSRASPDAARRCRGRRCATAGTPLPITPARLVSELWDVVRDVPHLLCLRNTRSWPEGVWELDGAGSYLGHSGGGGVGYGPGAFVGGALAARDRGLLGRRHHRRRRPAHGRRRAVDRRPLPDPGAARRQRQRLLLQRRAAPGRRRPRPRPGAGQQLDRHADRRPGHRHRRARRAPTAAGRRAPSPTRPTWPGAFTKALAAAQGGAVAVVHVRTEPA